MVQLSLQPNWPVLTRFLVDASIEPNGAREALEFARARLLDEHLVISLNRLAEKVSTLQRDVVHRISGLTCFISYAWPPPDTPDLAPKRVKRLRDDLREAGLTVYFDLDHNQLGDSITNFTRLLDPGGVDRVVLVGTKSLMDKVRAGTESVLVRDELPRICRRVEEETAGAERHSSVYPIIFEDEAKEVFPPKILAPRSACRLVYRPFHMSAPYPESLFVLIEGLLRTGDNIDVLQSIFRSEELVGGETANYPKRLEKPWQALLEKAWKSLEGIDWGDGNRLRACAAESAERLRIWRAGRSEGQRRVYRQQATEAQLRLQQLRERHREMCSARPMNTLLLDDTPGPIDKASFNLVGLEEGSGERATESIGLSRLFQARKTHSSPHSEITPRKILLVGPAGIGKTTICWHLVSQWAKGNELKEFSWVFPVELKRFVRDFPETRMSMAGILHRLFWPEMTVREVEELWRQIYDHALFVFDGYDEILDQRHPLVEEVLLAQAPAYLVTSRPFAVATLVGQVDDVLSSTGFTDEYVQTFINRKGLRKADELKATLQTNSQLAAFCRLPLHLEMLCREWDVSELAQQARCRATPTTLYRAVVLRLYRRMLAKRNVREQNLSDRQIETHPICLILSDFLGNLAFRTLKAGRLLISGEDLRIEYEAVTARVESCRGQLEADSLIPCLLGAGFLKSSGNSRSPFDNEYLFPHPTFLDYFAAEHVVDRLDEVAIHTIISDYKYDSRWSSVWQFVAGFNKKLDTYFNILLSEPRDIARVYETSLLARILGQVDPSICFANRGPLLRYFGQVLEAILEDDSGQPVDSQLARGMVESAGLWQLVDRSDGVPYLQKYVSNALHPAGPHRLATLGLCAAMFSNGVAPSTPLLEAIIGCAHDTDDEIREEAVSALGALLIAPDEVVGELLTAIEDKLATIRCSAYRALGRLYGPSPAVMSALINAAASGSRDARRAAAALLDQTRNPSQAIIDVCIAASRKSLPRERAAAVKVMGTVHNPPKPLLQAVSAALLDRDKSVRIVAIKAIGGPREVSLSGEVSYFDPFRYKELDSSDCSEDGDSSDDSSSEAIGPLNPHGIISIATLEMILQRLCGSLGSTFRDMSEEKQRPYIEEADALLATSAMDSDPGVRKAAIEVLGSLHSRSTAALDAIIRGLADQDSYVCEAALGAIQRLQFAPVNAIDAVLRLATDRGCKLQDRALATLAMVRGLSAVASSVLLAAMNQGDAKVRRTVMKMVGGMENPPEAIHGAVLEAMDDRDLKVRHAAISTIGKIGNPSAAARRKLLATVKDPRSEVGDESVRVLCALEDAFEYEDVVVWAISCDDPHRREAAMRALARRRTSAPAAVIKALKSASQAADPDFFKAALDALISVDAAHTTVLQTLSEGSKSKNPNIRFRALAGWLKMAARYPKAAIDTFMKAVDDEDDDVSLEALRIVRCLNPPPAMIDPILGLLKSKSSFDRHYAIIPLGRLQHPSAAVTKALFNAIGDECREVSEAAAKAITLRALCHHYPYSFWDQVSYQGALRIKLRSEVRAVVRRGASTYILYDGEGRVEAECSNPNQFERDVRRVYLLPQLNANQSLAIPNAVAGGAVGAMAVWEWLVSRFNVAINGWDTG